MNDIMGLDIKTLLQENQRQREENQCLRDLIARQEEQIAVLMQRVSLLE
ncbi:MAG: hypothetical protein HQL64_12945, partial [Magnetococcales bacterium]|nr:hypothetical protein [Magnetococcales bacterium]